jgi:hypothetical protein
MIGDVMIQTRIIRRTLLALAVIGALFISAGTARADFPSAPYFPLTDGLTWPYVLDIEGLSSTVIALPGTEPVNGIPTKVLQTSVEGSCDAPKTFYTNDASGIDLHRAFSPNVVILGSPRNVTATFSPPVVFANALTDLGQIVPSSGNAQLALSPPVIGSPFNLSYNASFTTANQFAARTVPAGMFSGLLQLDGTIMVTGTVLGQPVNLTLSFTFYLGQGIGIVESTSSVTTADGTNSATIKLTSLPLNHALTITCEPSGNPNPVASGGTANLSVTAQDSLPHPLTYAWTADCPAALVGDGSFNNATLQTPTWTAPQNTTGSQQDCAIQVTVSDGQGLTQSPSYPQGVSTEGAHTLTIIDGPSGSPDPVASGGTANLSVTAQDSLGHPLTYAWTADCPAALGSNGSFNNASLQTPTWTAPANTTGNFQDCTISVTVNDGILSPALGSYAQGVSANAPAALLVNLSTRAQVGIGADQVIGGFVIGGSTLKPVLIRALGPSLTGLGVPGALANPVLQLFSGQTAIAQNDDWQNQADPTCAATGHTCGDAAAITATGLAPPHPQDAALLITLAPGAYTAIVSGAGGLTGVGLVEVYEVATAP